MEQDEQRQDVKTEREGTRRDTMLALRLSGEEMALLKAAAARRGVPVSQFIRSAALATARPSAPSGVVLSVAQTGNAGSWYSTGQTVSTAQGAAFVTTPGVSPESEAPARQPSQAG